MNHFITTSLFVGMAFVLLPIQVYASVAGTVPEPLSLALVATGIAGLGVAELIRRRKSK